VVAALKQQFVTPEEYLEFERAAEVRHEYFGGYIRQMAGESLAHSRICVNVLREVSSRLRGTDCEALSPNMKVRAATKGMFAYPDLSVVCGKPEFHDEKKDVLLNAKVIVEVLSPSTQLYDRTRKLEYYLQEVQTLTDYILIHQEAAVVEQYYKSDGGDWRFRFIIGLDRTLTLESVGCDVPLSDIYDRVEFMPSTKSDDDS
jgi:Uma2 family endonuclease